jgi:hypothetical protein
MIRNWLKSNRKKVMVHSFIMGGFFLYLLFLADPLFDRFEAIPGESRLHKASLLSETDDVICGVDPFNAGSRAIEIGGWAFIEGRDTGGSKIYIILKSDKHTYVFDTMFRKRPDVTNYFRGLNLDLNWCGFEAIIPSRKIEKGEYIVGLYITKGDIEALQYLDKAIVKSKGSAKLTARRSKLQEASLPVESNDIRFSIDPVMKKKGKKLIEVVGWAFITGHSSERSNIYLVLKSDDNTYVFDTILQKRPDVTHAFEQLGLNLDNAGFLARIQKKDVKRGRYRLGIYIDKEPLKALHYTEKVIELK